MFSGTVSGAWACYHSGHGYAHDSNHAFWWTDTMTVIYKRCDDLMMGFRIYPLDKSRDAALLRDDR